MKKSTFKYIFVAAAAMLSSFGNMAMAEDEVTLLTVNLKDGTKEQYNLPDMPTVKIENHQVLINSGEMSGTYDFADVSHFSFERDIAVTAIDEIFDDNCSFAFSIVDNRYVYVEAPNLQWVEVYTIAGQRIMNVSASGSATLDVSSLAPGCYIVKPSCHEAVKIVKR